MYLDRFESLARTASDAQEGALAHQLHVDMGRFPPTDDGTDIMGLILPGPAHAPTPNSTIGSTTAQVTSNFQCSDGPLHAVEPDRIGGAGSAEYKEKGNQAFQAGDFVGAEQWYICAYGRTCAHFDDTVLRSKTMNGCICHVLTLIERREFRRFSMAILMDHEQDTYFANRSAARLALKNYKEALQVFVFLYTMPSKSWVKVAE